MAARLTAAVVVINAGNDGIGDIAGLRAKLPYLGRLGVDAIWINPWYPSPMADAGYDVADGRRVLGADVLGDRVVRAYQRSEEQRRQELSEFMTELRVPHARIASSAGIAAALAAMTGVYARAG